ncbi:MAG: hypothetical protein ACRD29_19965 [Acidimicrobiales bacterium]
MIDPSDRQDIAEPIDSVDPIENADTADPMEPIDSAEPIDPTDSTDPFDPIDNTESSDHRDHLLDPRRVRAGLIGTSCPVGDAPTESSTSALAPALGTPHLLPRHPTRGIRV